MGKSAALAALFCWIDGAEDAFARAASTAPCVAGLRGERVFCTRRLWACAGIGFWSFRPSGCAPAFGRAVFALCAEAFVRARARTYRKHDDGPCGDLGRLKNYVGFLQAMLPSQLVT
jgi:hypothetical protein